jgi:hypothetical protein
MLGHSALEGGGSRSKAARRPRHGWILCAALAGCYDSLTPSNRPGAPDDDPAVRPEYLRPASTDHGSKACLAMLPAMDVPAKSYGMGPGAATQPLPGLLA